MATLMAEVLELDDFGRAVIDGLAQSKKTIPARFFMISGGRNCSRSVNVHRSVTPLRFNATY